MNVTKRLEILNERAYRRELRSLRLAKVLEIAGYSAIAFGFGILTMLALASYY